MSFMRVTALGIGPLFAAFGALAMGCVGGEGSAPVGAVAEALDTDGFLAAAPVSTYDNAVPRAYPGHCNGQANMQRDGAYQEMMDQCTRHCAQSRSTSGGQAELRDIQCIDKDIGHRWSANCLCDGAGPASGPAVGPRLGGLPGGGWPGGQAAWPGGQTGWQSGPLGGQNGSLGWQNGSLGWQNGLQGWPSGQVGWPSAQPGLPSNPPFTQGPGWQPPAGWWDAPHPQNAPIPGVPLSGSPYSGSLSGAPNSDSPYANSPRRPTKL